MLNLSLFDSTEEKFDTLCSKVVSCVKCERMCESQRVLNRSIGPLNAPLMFVGEAPGRIGADSSGIPFHGDKSGQNFEELIAMSGLSRNEIVVTNSVLCNPKDEKGNNATPTTKEVINCNSFLQEQISIINPKIIITLGAKALEATRLLEGHELTLREHVRTSHKWLGRTLIPLYHPGQRAMLHRSFANQRSDYKYVFDFFNKIKNPSIKQYNRAIKADVISIAKYIIDKCGSITYFNLHKIFYLIEYNFYNEYKVRLSNAYIVRQKDGPYCTDLHLSHLKKAIPDLIYKKSGDYGNFVITRLRQSTLSIFDSPPESDFSMETKVLIDSVVSKYGSYTPENIKRASYLTRPMRNILKFESENRTSLYNTPLNFTQ